MRDLATSSMTTMFDGSRTRPPCSSSSSINVDALNLPVSAVRHNNECLAKPDPYFEVRSHRFRPLVSTPQGRASRDSRSAGGFLRGSVGLKKGLQRSSGGVSFTLYLEPRAPNTQAGQEREIVV